MSDINSTEETLKSFEKWKKAIDKEHEELSKELVKAEKLNPPLSDFAMEMLIDTLRNLTIRSDEVNRLILEMKQ